MVLLDVMLQNFPVLMYASRFKEFSDVPIIMLTAKGEDMDKILGLSMVRTIILPNLSIF